MRRLAQALSLVLLAVFLYGVWPTPYRYFVAGDHALIRMNRFTSRTAVLGDTGWVPMHRNPFADLADSLRTRQKPDPFADLRHDLQSPPH